MLEIRFKGLPPVSKWQIAVSSFFVIVLVAVGGDADYLLRVVVEDVQALERLIIDKLTPISVIAKIRSSFALKQVKYKTALPLPK